MAVTVLSDTGLEVKVQSLLRHVAVPILPVV
jgi:hypothetical protein